MLRLPNLNSATMILRLHLATIMLLARHRAEALAALVEEHETALIRSRIQLVFGQLGKIVLGIWKENCPI